MSVHSGGRAVDPALVAATRAALGEAREVVVVVTRAVHGRDHAAAAAAVADYLTVTDDPVRYSGRVNAVMSVLVQIAARIVGDRVSTRSGAVISLLAPDGADASRRAALAAVSCAANNDLPAAVRALLTYAARRRAGGARSHPYAELVVDLCVVCEQLAGEAARDGGAGS